MKKEKDTYTRYMEYLEKNRSKRERKIALKTCFVYASHYVPLIVIANSKPITTTDSARKNY